MAPRWCVYIAHRWRLPKLMIALFVLETPLTIACLVFFGVADPDTYRTRLWQNGSDKHFNSNPNEILYSYANYQPIKVPLIWSQLYVYEMRNVGLYTLLTTAQYDAIQRRRYCLKYVHLIGEEHNVRPAHLPANPQCLRACAAYRALRLSRPQSGYTRLEQHACQRFVEESTLVSEQGLQVRDTGELRILHAGQGELCSYHCDAVSLPATRGSD